MTETSPTADDPRLVESEERYRAVIEYASDMIQSVRPDASFEFVNKAWLDSFGYTEQEVDAISVWDTIHPDSMDHCQVLFSEAARGIPLEFVEAIFLAKDGRPIPVEGSVTSRSIDGEVVATHGFFRDITQRLRAEELEDRNVELERQQRARYLEKMAALGKLSAGLAHELNNPAAASQRASARLLESLTHRDAALRALRELGLDDRQWQTLDDVVESIPEEGSADLGPLEIDEREGKVEAWLDGYHIPRAWEVAPTLVQAGITEERLDALARRLPSEALATVVDWLSGSIAIRDSVRIINRSGHRISELVRAVKGYSYMDRATEQTVDVHEGLESTLIILNHRLRDMTVKREYDRNLPKIRVFGNSLNQVWTNILDNTVDATDGSGTISIRTGLENGQVLVEVEDDGAGIAPEHLATIFEPFFTTKPQGQGTGLGLDTAWRIVTEEHGGTIHVESQPGRTVFQVTLPVT